MECDSCTKFIKNSMKVLPQIKLIKTLQFSPNLNWAIIIRYNSKYCKKCRTGQKNSRSDRNYSMLLKELTDYLVYFCPPAM